MITVPGDFATATLAREGEAGRAWVADLPRRVEVLCEQWNVVVDGAPMHGYMGLVVPVRRGEEACALKVCWIDESTVDEAAALSAWNGRGAVKLLAAERECGAILLEWLDHRRSLNDVGIEEAVTVAGQLLCRLAIAAPPGFRSLRAMAEQLSETLPERWERYGRPIPRKLLERARSLASELGASAGNLLVNYDLHYADVLAGEREPWLAVDPKVVVGDAEFGVAQLLWWRLEEMQAAGGLARHFCALTEAGALDHERARSWTVVRCVDYWLWGLSVGLTYDPARCEAILDRLA